MPRSTMTRPTRVTLRPETEAPTALATEAGRPMSPLARAE